MEDNYSQTINISLGHEPNKDLDEKDHCIPIKPNMIQVKGADIKILGTSVTSLDDTSDEFIDYILLEMSTSNLPPAKFSHNVHHAHHVTHCEALDTDSKSITIQGSETTDEISRDSMTGDISVPATLRLLEEVTFRILGEKDVLEIERVEITEEATVDDEDDTEESETESSDQIDGEEKGEEKAEEEEGEEGEEEEGRVCEKHGEEFLPTYEFSQVVVDTVLQNAKQICRVKHKRNVRSVGFGRAVRKPPNIVWPSIDSFTIDVGIKSIKKYIHCLHLTEDWMFKVTYLIAQSDEVSDFYMYEAKFCIPSSCYPIAQATVSLFFNFEVCRVIPEDLPVRVTFTVESLRRVMIPGEVDVSDKLLLGVVNCKLTVFKDLRF